jgi:hypothetical protein
MNRNSRCHQAPRKTAEQTKEVEGVDVLRFQPFVGLVVVLAKLEVLNVGAEAEGEEQKLGCGKDCNLPSGEEFLVGVEEVRGGRTVY